MNHSDEELIRVCEETLEEARALEPGDWEIHATRASQVRSRYENDDFTVSSSHESDLFGIRVVSNGRLGFATTNSHRKESLAAAVREAQGVSRLSPRGEHHSIATADQGGKNAHFENWDPALADLSPRGVAEALDAVIRELRKADRPGKAIAINRAEVECSRQVVAIATSTGIRKSRSETQFSWSSLSMGKSDSEVSQFDYDGGVVGSLDRVSRGIEETMGRLRDSALGSLGAGKGKSYKGRVLLHPCAVQDLIMGTVLANANGRAQQDGQSRWVGKLGTAVASESLTLAEDPLDRARAGWSPFDREGIACERREILRAGVLSFAAQDLFSARRGGTNPTGNALGGSRALPSIGFRNPELVGSNRGEIMPETALRSALGTGLLLKRFSGNADRASGSFSGVAKNSHWVEGGEPRGAVKDVMIAGNLFDLLSQVLAVGDRPTTIFGEARAPFILVDGVSVTAA